MKCSVNGRQNVRHLGEQKFGGNLPQLTRKLRSTKKIFLGHFRTSGCPLIKEIINLIIMSAVGQIAVIVNEGAYEQAL